MNILIIYYSRTGNTEKIANNLAKATNAKTVKLQERKPRSGVFGLFCSALQALFSRPSKVRYVEADPAQYDVLILGGPVWMMRLVPALRGYILKEKKRFNRVAFFCTEGSSGGQKVFETMEELCERPPIATLEVTEANIKSGKYADMIHRFVRTLQESIDKNKAVVAA